MIRELHEQHGGRLGRPRSPDGWRRRRRTPCQGTAQAWLAAHTAHAAHLQYYTFGRAPAGAFLFCAGFVDNRRGCRGRDTPMLNNTLGAKTGGKQQKSTHVGWAVDTGPAWRAAHLLKRILTALWAPPGHVVIALQLSRVQALCAGVQLRGASLRLPPPPADAAPPPGPKVRRRAFRRAF